MGSFKMEILVPVPDKMNQSWERELKSVIFFKWTLTKV